MDFDARDMRRFAADLERAGAVAAAKARPVVAKGALNVKRDWQQALGESTHFKGVKQTPTYDTKVRGGGDSVEAEIGPRTAGKVPGDLVHIAHFGGARGGGGVADPQTFLDNEEGAFVRSLEDVLSDLP